MSDILWKTVHLLGVSLVVTAVYATLLWSYRDLNEPGRLQGLKSLRQLGSLGALVAIVTGVIIAFHHRITLAGNWSFVVKLLLVAADGLIAQLVFGRLLNAALARRSGVGLQQKLVGWAWVSVIIITAVVAISVFREKS